MKRNINNSLAQVGKVTYETKAIIVLQPKTQKIPLEKIMTCMCVTGSSLDKIASRRYGRKWKKTQIK